MKKLVIYSGRPVIAEAVRELPFEIIIVAPSLHLAGLQIAGLKGCSLLKEKLPNGQTVADVLLQVYGSPKVMSEHLCDKGIVLDGVNQSSKLYGYFEDRTMGELEGDYPRPIRIFYKNLSIPLETIDAIKDGDITIIGPGYLFKETLPSVLPFKDEVKNTKTFFFPSLTDIYGYSSGEQAELVNEHLENHIVNKCIVNTGLGKLNDIDLMTEAETLHINHVYADLVDSDLYFTYSSGKIRKVLENELL